MLRPERQAEVTLFAALLLFTPAKVVYVLLVELVLIGNVVIKRHSLALLSQGSLFFLEVLALVLGQRLQTLHLIGIPHHRPEKLPDLLDSPVNRR